MSDKERLSLHGNGATKKHTSGSRGMGPWIPVVLVVLLAGGAAWFWLGSDPVKRDALVEATKETIAEVKEKADQIIPSDAKNSGSEERIVMATEEGVMARGSAPEAEGDADAATAGADVEADAGANADSGFEGADSEPSSETDVESEQAENNVQGEEPVDMDTSARQEQASSAKPDTPVTRGLLTSEASNAVPPANSRQDDAVVRVAFLDDLAQWMVAGYAPATSRGGRGGISVGIQAANARYGIGMQGLSWIGDDLPAGRAEALGYVYTPGMLDALYRMYIDRFMDAMANASASPRKDGKTLEPEQIAEMYRLYARRFRSLSGTMQGIAAVTDLRARATGIHNASKNMLDANSKYMEAVFAFDQARAAGGNEKGVDSARKAMEAASDTYQQATYERDRLREELIGLVRKNPEARSLGDDNVLYVALWVDRRLQKSPQALDASMQAATLFLDIAQRFENVTGVRP